MGEPGSSWLLHLHGSIRWKWTSQPDNSKTNSNGLSHAAENDARLSPIAALSSPRTTAFHTWPLLRLAPVPRRPRFASDECLVAALDSPSSRERKKRTGRKMTRDGFRDHYAIKQIARGNLTNLPPIFHRLWLSHQRDSMNEFSRSILITERVALDTMARVRRPSPQRPLPHD